MTKRKLKKPIIYSLYVLSFCLLIGGLFLLEISNRKYDSNSQQDFQYVSKTVMDNDDIQVVNTNVTISRPYSDKDIKIVKSYYNYKGTEDEQKNSIIYYENTYMPSNGVSYGKDSEFSVVAILDGTVKSVKEDETLGNVIVIEHDNGIISTYQSVKDIKVKEGSTVKQGDIIATSSTSNISSDLNNHLYFELSINNETVNPEEYYDKSIDEIGA